MNYEDEEGVNMYAVQWAEVGSDYSEPSARVME